MRVYTHSPWTLLFTWPFYALYFALMLVVAGFVLALRALGWALRRVVR